MSYTIKMLDFLILKGQKTRRLRYKTKSESIGSKKNGRNALEQMDGFTEIRNAKLSLKQNIGDVSNGSQEPAKVKRQL